METEAELFILGEDGMVIMNKAWISTIKEFKALLARDKSTGKKKAQSEFTFIYHYIDFRSQYDQLGDEEKFIKALKNAGLPENLKVDKDIELKAAMDEYDSIKVTRKLKIIRSARKAVDTLSNYYNIATIGDANAAKELMSSVNLVGKTLDNLDILDKQVKEELANVKGLRGSSRKGTREDPTK